MTAEDGTLFGVEGGSSGGIGLQVAQDADNLAKIFDGG